MTDDAVRETLIKRIVGLHDVNLNEKLVYDEDIAGSICEDEFRSVAKAAKADDFLYGRSKLILKYRDLDYVLKIPIFRFIDYDEDNRLNIHTYTNANEIGIGSDYCMTEADIYDKAIAASVEMFFAGTEYLCDIDRYPIYISQKAHNEFICTDYLPDASMSDEIIKYGQAIGISTNGLFDYDERLAKNFFHENELEYGIDKIYDLLDFFKDTNISDLHSDNVGRDRLGRMIILDYPGFFD